MKDQRFAAPGAPEIRVRVAGHGRGLLLIHGFASGLDGWPAEELEALSRIRRVVAIDLPGHGSSDAAPPGSAEGDALVRILDAVRRAHAGDDPADVLGYSMGARLALAAVAGGMPAASLLLESPNPGIEDPMERTQRAVWDERWARRFDGEPLPQVLDDWLDQDIFASRADLPAAEAARQRRVREAAHGPSLAVWLREFGTGSMTPTWDALRSFRGPVHVAVGARDAKYVALARRIDSAVPAAVVTTVAGAGHAPHMEAPSAWGDWVRSSLEAP